MNVPRRMLLPIGHLIVDCAVLLHWLWIGSIGYTPRADVLRHHARIVQCQEDPAISFDPVYDVQPPRDILFLTGGNVPAMILSTALRPEGRMISPKQLWDPVWFSIHEAISFLLWFGIGELLDSGILGTRRLLLGFLFARICVAASMLMGGIGDLAWKFEVMFWLVFALYVIAASLRFAVSRLPVRGAGGA